MSIARYALGDIECTPVEPRQGDPVCRISLSGIRSSVGSRLVLRFPAHISFALKQTGDYHLQSNFFLPTS